MITKVVVVVTVMDNVAVAVLAGDAESVTCTVKLVDPAADGTPEISPLLPEVVSFNPVGNVDPEASDQV